MKNKQPISIENLNNSIEFAFKQQRLEYINLSNMTEMGNGFKFEVSTKDPGINFELFAQDLSHYFNDNFSFDVFECYSEFLEDEGWNFGRIQLNINSKQ